MLREHTWHEISWRYNRVWRWVCSVSVLCAISSPAQHLDSTLVGAQRNEEAVRPRSLWVREPGDSVPSAGGRWLLLARRNLLSTQAAARLLLPSVLAQVTNSPEHWGRTTEGLGQRLGRSFVSNASRDLLLSASTAALRQDPRYQRCACSGVGRRLGHALTGVVAFGTGDGRRRFGPGNLVAAAGAGYLDAMLYAENGTISRPHVARRASALLLRSAVTNLTFEFLPELRRAVREVLR